MTEAKKPAAEKAHGPRKARAKAAPKERPESAKQVEAAQKGSDEPLNEGVERAVDETPYTPPHEATSVPRPDQRVDVNDELAAQFAARRARHEAARNLAPEDGPNPSADRKRIADEQGIAEGYVQLGPEPAKDDDPEVLNDTDAVILGPGAEFIDRTIEMRDEPDEKIHGQEISDPRRLEAGPTSGSPDVNPVPRRK